MCVSVGSKNEAIPHRGRLQEAKARVHTSVIVVLV